jgi:hypothetical protein
MQKRKVIVGATGIQVRDPVLHMFVWTCVKDILGCLSLTYSSTFRYGALEASHVTHPVKSHKLDPENELRLSNATSTTRPRFLQPWTAPPLSSPTPISSACAEHWSLETPCLGVLPTNTHSTAISQGISVTEAAASPTALMTLDRFVYSFFERFPQMERQQIHCSPSLQFRSRKDLLGMLQTLTWPKWMK